MRVYEQARTGVKQVVRRHLRWANSIPAQTMTNMHPQVKTTLTMEDLSAALGEHGINNRKPDYYV